MKTPEIAKQLVDYCRKGEFDTAQTKLFADNAVSIEPFSTPEFEKETKGLKAIHDKGKKFESMVEESHSIETSEPLVAGNTIAFTLTMDMTMKGKGRSKMEELCVYQVKDGKVVSEEFFM